MSTLHVAAIAAGAAQHSSHGDDTSGMYLAVAFGLYFGAAGLGWALGSIRNYLPHGKWRSRVHLATLLMYYPHTIYMDDKNLNSSIRTQVHNLFRCKKYVGWTFVYMNPDETYFQVKVDKTWWDTGRILGSFGNGGVVDIGNLLLNGQHRLEKSGVWFVTNERWVTVQENMRAEARRKAEGNLSPDVLTALAILGLSTESPATLDTINAARNKLGVLTVSHLRGRRKRLPTSVCVNLGRYRSAATAVGPAPLARRAPSIPDQRCLRTSLRSSRESQLVLQIKRLVHERRSQKGGERT
jgi:hypothetical protein